MHQQYNIQQLLLRQFAESSRKKVQTPHHSLLLQQPVSQKNSENDFFAFKK